MKLTINDKSFLRRIADNEDAGRCPAEEWGVSEQMKKLRDGGFITLKGITPSITAKGRRRVKR